MYNCGRHTKSNRNDSGVVRCPNDLSRTSPECSGGLTITEANGETKGVHYEQFILWWYFTYFNRREQKTEYPRSFWPTCRFSARVVGAFTLPDNIYPDAQWNNLPDSCLILDSRYHPPTYTDHNACPSDEALVYSTSLGTIPQCMCGFTEQIRRRNGRCIASADCDSRKCARSSSRHVISNYKA